MSPNWKPAPTPGAASFRADGVWRSIRGVAGRVRDDLSAWADIRSLFPLAVWCGLNCVGLMILMRRAAGPGAIRLSAASWLAAATSAAALSLIARGALARVESQAPRRWMRGLAGIVSAFPLASLAAAAPGAAGYAGHAYVAALIGGSLVWGVLCDRGRLDWLLFSALSPAARQRERLARVAARPGPDAGRRASAEALPAAACVALSHLERLILPAGDDVIQGTATARFAAEQAAVEVHVAFCPPLARSPEVSCEAVEAQGVRLKVGSAFPWGCRFDLKRTGDLSTGRSVTIRFRAAVAAAKKAA